jgi:hypothetical protein
MGLWQIVVEQHREIEFFRASKEVAFAAWHDEFDPETGYPQSASPACFDRDLRAPRRQGSLDYFWISAESNSGVKIYHGANTPHAAAIATAENVSAIRTSNGKPVRRKVGSRARMLLLHEFRVAEVVKRA